MKNNMGSNNRLPYIDLLESIAIFFVVAYHATAYDFNFLQTGALSDYCEYFFRTIFSTCVPLFFFANGYLLFDKAFDLKKHVKKIVKLIVLIVIWALMLMAIYLKIEGQTISLNSIMVPILNLDTGYSINLFWYLGALIGIYIIFPLLKTTFDNNKKAFFFFVAICAVLTLGYDLANEIVLLMSTFTHSLETGLELPFVTMFNPFRGWWGYSIVYFCFGGIVRENKEKIISFSVKKRNVISLVGIVVSCSCLFAMGVLHSRFIHGQEWDIVWNGYDTIFTFLNVFFIYILTLNYKKDCKFIKEISVNTLGIYFMHGVLLKVTKEFLNFSCLRNLPLNLLYSFIILCACLVICITLRKIPYVKKLIGF